LNASGGVTANYSVSTSAGTSQGTLAMLNNQFRVLSPEIKCWFDGKNQWAWSTATDEVNVTTPTADELQMTNPIAAAQSFKKNFNLKKAKARTPNTYVIKLAPKKRDNIKIGWLYFDTKTSLLRTARFDMNDGTVVKIKITNYKLHQQLTPDTFKFDPKLVPIGTLVNDLR